MKLRQVFLVGLVLAALFGGLIHVAFSQEPAPASVQAEVDRTEITIGDQIQYRINLEYQNGVEVSKPAWGQGLESFQILDFERGEPQKVGENWKVTDTYTLSTFTPEDYVIPPLQIPVKLPSGATQVLETQPINIKVKSVLPTDDEVLQLKDVKPPVSVFSGLFISRVVTIAGVLLGILVILWILWRRNRKGNVAEVRVPPKPEHEVALNRLEQLRRMVESLPNLPTQDECKVFALELSELFREYLERRYQFNALEMTTHEINTVLPTLNLADSTKSHDELRKIAIEILELTDLMKFAKGIQSRETLFRKVDQCREWIQITQRSDVKLKEGMEVVLPEDQVGQQAA